MLLLMLLLAMSPEPPAGAEPGRRAVACILCMLNQKPAFAALRERRTCWGGPQDCRKPACFLDRVIKAQSTVLIACVYLIVHSMPTTVNMCAYILILATHKAGNTQQHLGYPE